MFFNWHCATAHVLTRAAVVAQIRSNQFQGDSTSSFVEFPELRQVDGKVYIYNNGYLRTISAPKLVNVSGTLDVQYGYMTSFNMTSLARTGGVYMYQASKDGTFHLDSWSFPSLHTIDGQFEIRDNYYMGRLEMPKLSRINSYVCLYNSGNYGDRGGFELELPVLETIGSYMDVNYWRYGQAWNLTSLRSIGSYFRWRDSYSGNTNERLEFPALESIGSYLYMYSTYNLEIVSMPSLATVGGDFYLYNNYHLREFQTPLSRVQGSLYFYNNDQYPNLAFDNISSVGGRLYIHSNTILFRVSFTRLRSVSSELQFYSNAQLRSVTFDSLRSIGSYTYIYSNPLLEQLHFEKLESSSYIRILYNAQLRAVDYTSLSSISSTVRCGDSNKYKHVCIRSNANLDNVTLSALYHNGSYSVSIPTTVCVLYNLRSHGCVGSTWLRLPRRISRYALTSSAVLRPPQLSIRRPIYWRPALLP